MYNTVTVSVPLESDQKFQQVQDAEQRWLHGEFTFLLITISLATSLFLVSIQSAVLNLISFKLLRPRLSEWLCCFVQAFLGFKMLGRGLSLSPTPLKGILREDKRGVLWGAYF